MLYILRHSPYSCDLSSLLNTAQPGDDLLLLSDGIIAGLRNTEPIYLLNKSPLCIYALSNDVIARGLSNYIAYNIKIISYTEFVALTEKHLQQLSW